MSTVRIKDIATTAASVADDDYLALDGVTKGTRKIAAADILGASGVTAGTYGGTGSSAAGTTYKIPSLTVNEQGRVTSASQTFLGYAAMSKGKAYGGLISASDYEVLMGRGSVHTFTREITYSTTFSNSTSYFAIMESYSSSIPEYPFISAQYKDVDTGELYPLRFRKFERSSAVGSVTYVYFDVEALATDMGRSASKVGDLLIVHSNYAWTDNGHM